MSYQPNSNRPHTSIRDSDLKVQSLPELDDTFFDFSSDSSDGFSILSSSPSPKPSSRKFSNPKSSPISTKISTKSYIKGHRKRISNSETDMRGSQFTWRSGLDDTPYGQHGSDMVASATDFGAGDASWYNGEDNQEIERDWAIIPIPKQKSTSAQQEGGGEDEEKRPSQISQRTRTVTTEKWQVLPQVAEKSVEELRREEEEVHRYQRGLWRAEIAEMGQLGWECFWKLGNKWSDCVERL